MVADRRVPRHAEASGPELPLGGRERARVARRVVVRPEVERVRVAGGLHAVVAAGAAVRAHRAAVEHRHGGVELVLLRGVRDVAGDHHGLRTLAAQRPDGGIEDLGGERLVGAEGRVRAGPRGGRGTARGPATPRRARACRSAGRRWRACDRAAPGCPGRAAARRGRRARGSRRRRGRRAWSAASRCPAARPPARSRRSRRAPSSTTRASGRITPPSAPRRPALGGRAGRRARSRRRRARAGPRPRARSGRDRERAAATRSRRPAGRRADP